MTETAHQGAVPFRPAEKSSGLLCVFGAAVFPLRHSDSSQSENRVQKIHALRLKCYSARRLQHARLQGTNHWQKGCRP